MLLLLLLLLLLLRLLRYMRRLLTIQVGFGVRVLLFLGVVVLVVVVARWEWVGEVNLKLLRAIGLDRLFGVIRGWGWGWA
jgi:hypothetical protein